MVASTKVWRQKRIPGFPSNGSYPKEMRDWLTVFGSYIKLTKYCWQPAILACCGDLGYMWVWTWIPNTIDVLVKLITVAHEGPVTTMAVTDLWDYTDAIFGINRSCDQGHVTIPVKSLSCVWLFVTPWTVPTTFFCPWDFPCRSTGMGCHFLLQRIFPTQGSNPSLPHFRHRRFTVCATREHSILIS